MFDSGDVPDLPARPKTANLKPPTPPPSAPSPSIDINEQARMLKQYEDQQAALLAQRQAEEAERLRQQQQAQLEPLLQLPLSSG